MAKRKVIDWEAVEKEYIAGQLSIREIGVLFGCSHVAIQKHAKKHGWTRDLADKIRKKVTTKLVTTEVTKPHINEKEIIEAAAQRGVAVIRSHRKILSDSLDIIKAIISEFNAEQVLREDAQKKDDEKDDKKDKMTARAKAELIKALSNALHRLIPLERQAFNLNESEKKPGVPGSQDPDEVMTGDEQKALRLGFRYAIKKMAANAAISGTE